MDGFCLVNELHRGGSANNKATQSILLSSSTFIVKLSPEFSFCMVPETNSSYKKPKLI